MPSTRRANNTTELDRIIIRKSWPYDGRVVSRAGFERIRLCASPSAPAEHGTLATRWKFRTIFRFSRKRPCLFPLDLVFFFFGSPRLKLSENLHAPYSPGLVIVSPFQSERERAEKCDFLRSYVVIWYNVFFIRRFYFDNKHTVRGK